MDQKFSNLLAIILLSSLVCSCSNKDTLPGKREQIFTNKVDLSVSPDKISVGAAQNITQLPDPLYNKENLSPVVQFNFNQLRKVWPRKISAKSDITNSGNILAVNGLVYFTDSFGNVYCVNAENGSSIWKLRTSPRDKSYSVGTYISYMFDKLYITTSFCELIVVNATSGKVLNKREFDSAAKSSPRYIDGKIYVMQTDNSFEVINPVSLRTIWRHAALFEENGLLGLGSVAIANDVVIVPYKNGEVFAFQKDSWQKLWSYSLFNQSITESIAAMAHIKASPVVYKNNVYILSNCGKCAAFNASSGAPIWESMIGGGIYSPILSGNAMYFLSNENTVIALNNRTGKKFWVSTLPEIKDQTYIWYKPLLTSSGLFVANSIGHFVIIDPKTGKITKTLNTKLNICASPVIINKTLFILTDSGLIAYR